MYIECVKSPMYVAVEQKVSLGSLVVVWNRSRTQRSMQHGRIPVVNVLFNILTKPILDSDGDPGLSTPEMALPML